jgi:hypothetical protein
MKSSEADRRATASEDHEGRRYRRATAGAARERKPSVESLGSPPAALPLARPPPPRLRARPPRYVTQYTTVKKKKRWRFMNCFGIKKRPKVIGY